MTLGLIDAFISALTDTGKNASMEAVKDGVNQLNKALEGGKPLDPKALSAEIRESIGGLPDEILQDLIDQGIIADDAYYRLPARPTR